MKACTSGIAAAALGDVDEDRLAERLVRAICHGRKARLDTRRSIS